MQPPSDLHGCGHTARVMVWASVLTRGTTLHDTVVWAAACHDLRREDDGWDPEHGFRAGDWVRTQLAKHLTELPANLEWIASACDWHVCRDPDAEWNHPALWLLKDADGLDRARLYDLDPGFLRHDETHEWIVPARDLFARTADLDDSAAIWTIAGEEGLPVDELEKFVERWGPRLVSRAESRR
jgi:uncharacterized protein